MKGVRHGRAEDDGARRRASRHDRRACRSTRSRRSLARCSSSTRPTCALNQAGVVVRARRIQGGRGDTVDQAAAGRPRRAARRSSRSTSAFNVEVDIAAGRLSCARHRSRARASGSRDPRRGAPATAPLRKLFSKEQRAFYKEHAPAGIDLDDLAGRSARRSSSSPSFTPHGRLGPPVRRGALALPGRHRASSSCRPSACRRRGLPGRRRDAADVPRRAAASPSGRHAADEDQDARSSSSAPSCARRAPPGPRTSPSAGRGSTKTARSSSPNADEDD